MKKIFTLCLVHVGNTVLLGMKKRGFGQGKWNGFGGKVAEGESVQDAAKRELFEESGLKAQDLQKMGVVEFSWKNTPEEILQVHIFKTTQVTGEPKETEEMRPQWFLTSKVPFDQMWPSDRYWFPLLLENKQFTGTCIFDNADTIVEYQLNETPL